mmetsp:Transcript_5863/g.13411  ORF Transcript_5863/g.13411 Transcript_5863/m.13411 type:complete len:470 (-) Transcript_5863:98-1507(-)
MPLLAYSARMSSGTMHYSYLNSTGWAEIEKFTDEELDAKCPLGRKSKLENGVILQEKVEDPEKGGTLCCNKNKFFQCFSITLRPKDVVFLNGVDEDIPPGSFGKVTEVSPPHVYAKFPRGEWPFWPESLRLGVAPTEPRKPNDWFCNCDDCISTLSENVDFLSYGIRTVSQPNTGVHTMEVRAEFDPKVKDLYSAPRQFAKGHKYVLFLYPFNDPNAAFGFKKTLCARLSCWAKRDYRVVLRIVDSVAAAQKIVTMFPRRSLHHVIIGGHGAARRIRFGEEVVGDFTVGEKESTRLLTLLREKLQISGSVLLDACDTARQVWVGSNFFTWVGDLLPSRRVVAAEVDLSDSMWEQQDNHECLSSDSVVFKRDGVDVTAMRHAGRALCHDLSVEEIEVWASESKKCETYCGGTCATAASLWAADERVDANVRLDPTKEKYSISGCIFSRRMVCQLVPPPADQAEEEDENLT